MKVDIQKVADALEMVSEGSTDWFDVKTQEHIGVNDFMETESQQEVYDRIDAEPERYYRLPSQYELHGYSMMEDFIDSLSDDRVKNDLLRAIRGKGAFRRFKDTLAYHGIREEWFAFERKAYVELAECWCRDNGLEYDDTTA